METTGQDNKQQFEKKTCKKGVVVVLHSPAYDLAWTCGFVILDKLIDWVSTQTISSF